MFRSREDGAAAASGWSKEEEEERDTGRMNPNHGGGGVGWGSWGGGGSLKAPVSLQQMDHCVASRGEWVLRVFLVPALARLFIPHFTSVSLLSPFLLRPSLPLLCLLLFCLSVRVSLLLTFSHTKVIHCRFHSGIFFPDGLFCVFLSVFFFFFEEEEEEEQVGKLLVTGEEC